MLNRLLMAVHWLFLIIIIILWLLTLVFHVDYGIEQGKFQYSFMLDFLTFTIPEIIEIHYDKSGIMIKPYFYLLWFSLSSLMTWFPILLIYINWLINGKWVWFPWQRRNE